MSKPSLRRKLLQHVLWPLCLTWAVGATLAWGLSHYFATQAYDRALLDDAYALSAQMRLDAQGALQLGLTDAEMRAVLFDQSESIYFSIWREDGRLLAGHSALRQEAEVANTVLQDGTAVRPPQWRDASYLGKAVRVVTVWRTLPAPHTVLVAQTTASRTQMLQRLLLLSVVPQLLLLGLLAWWLRRQVGRDVLPLVELQHALGQRDATDLRPVPEHLAGAARTTDIEHLGLSVNALFDRVLLGLQAQREFSGNVAHELRTPIAAIRLQTEHALSLTPDAALRERLHKLLQSTDQASHLIDQLLALALAQEAEQSIVCKWLDGVQVVQDAVLRHWPLAQARGVDLGADLDADLGRTQGLGIPEGGVAKPQIWGHPVLIAAALDNLLDNALRYGGGADKPTITVTLTCNQQGAELMVTDNGPGLSAQARVAVQARWAQGHTIEKRGSGVGLGLAIVSRYAQVMRAQFVLEEAPTGGLCAKLKWGDVPNASNIHAHAHEPPVPTGL